ncbi:MAG: hypothetical protein F6K11_37295 [Leptolyngbya sp. SIO3F4]|nr:hypothetical protein [Leptolyngbya sp. SIO3F4]
MLSDLNFTLSCAFNKAGIEIPFPQRDINLPEIPIPIRLSDDSLTQSNRQRLDKYRSD